jgi:hypothetical protein
MLTRVAALLLALALPLSSQSPVQSGKPTTTAGKPPAAVSADSTPATANLPDGRALIDKFIKAIGGREAVLSHKSEHAVGTLSMNGSGMTGTVELFGATDPNRSLQRVSMSGIGEVTNGFDGQHGWTIDPMSGPRLQVGAELDQTKITADFYAELRDPKSYPSVKTIERDDFEGHPCYKVSLTNIYGVTDYDYYDVGSGLRVGAIETEETPMGKITATSVIGDYKKFGNLLQATTLTQRAMGVEQKITLQSVEYDNVDASVFDLPAPIKALIK